MVFCSWPPQLCTQDSSTHQRHGEPTSTNSPKNLRNTATGSSAKPQTGLNHPPMNRITKWSRVLGVQWVWQKTLQPSGSGWSQGLNKQGCWRTLPPTRKRLTVWSQGFWKFQGAGCKSGYDLGNPFLDDSDELVASDTRNVVTRCSLGKDQYAKYCKEVLTDYTHSIHEPIKKNGLQSSKTQEEKSSEYLFTQEWCYSVLSPVHRSVMQHRSSDMSTFFSHKNHPSLSDGSGKKSDLLNILTKETLLITLMWSS